MPASGSTSAFQRGDRSASDTALTPKGLPRDGGRTYLFSGMVRCASGHQPLAMYGRERKRHTYLCCDYGRAYGKTAAEQIDGHGQWLYLREDALLPLVEQFFAQRIFGPMRLQKLAGQLRTQQRQTKHAAAQDNAALRRQVADLDHRIGLQLNALEKGIEPELVGQRIAQLPGEGRGRSPGPRTCTHPPTRPYRGPRSSPRTRPRPHQSPHRRPNPAQAASLRRLRATYRLRQAPAPHRDQRHRLQRRRKHPP